jgi:putative DNA primase/helicase
VQPLKTRTADEAVGRWPGILQALGVDPKFLSKRHGPCPICGGTDRYRFDDKGGRGTWFCSQCGAGDGFKLLELMLGWGFVQAAKQVDAVIGTAPTSLAPGERSAESKAAVLREAWKQSKPISKGDPAWLYLHRRTGIDVAPADLRFHPSMRHSEGGNHPAMLALMRYPDGQSASIHRTYLTQDGQKAAVKVVRKFMEGKPLQTASVRLGAAGEVLGLAEGIETALAASSRFGLPVWAATNAVLMEHWAPPEGVKQIIVFGDNDRSYTGQSAAFALCKRLVRDGYQAEAKIPDTVDRDWADDIYR